MMELALGTVQFGLPYGVAGRSQPVNHLAARKILEAAARDGVRWLDTASAYGDIEQRLVPLCHDLQFNIVSKLPALPAGLNDRASQGFFLDAFRRSYDRLGKNLKIILFHELSDLNGPQGESIWSAVENEATAAGIRLGISCYRLDELDAFQARFQTSAAQLPGNAFDQSLADLKKDFAPSFLQLRSAFLQGLLLMPEREASRRLPIAASALRRWHAWYKSKGLNPLEAALGIVKGFPAVDLCVVGVDGLEQFKQVSSAWSRSTALDARELTCVDPYVIDPRQWKLLR